MAGYGTRYGINQYGLEIDLVGPLVTAINPHKDETQVPVNTDITVEITDDEGVKDDSINIWIDRGAGFVLVFAQGETPQFKSGYDGPSSAVTNILGGFRVVIDPDTDFETGELIHVKVAALDLAGNPERLA